jgi:hypothetical protein
MQQISNIFFLLLQTVHYNILRFPEEIIIEGIPIVLLQLAGLSGT